MLLEKGSSETRLFRDLTDYVLGVRNTGNTKSLRELVFSKYSKLNVNFRRAEKT